VMLLSLFLSAGIGVLVVPPVWAAFLPSDDPRAENLRQFSDTAGDWVIPALMVSMLLFGHLRGVKVYEQFVEGAKEGFETAVRIIPYMVAILVAVGMFRASGAMGLLTGGIGAWTGPMGLPGDAIPMALVRPLSGSGAFAVMSEILHTHGPDTYIGYLVSVLNGSTETTFYVMAVYFGAVGVSRARHAVAAGLTADLTGVIATVLVCRVLFGHLMA
ncbi:MAG: spore maturation protein, partial [Myxococcota bacterium]|nr:spore maturation protein [Myxococcota bacterium]